MTQTFSKLNLKAALLENLQSLGFLEMTQIQSQSLPAILDGRDVIARANTGSGKTAAFGLGLLNTIDARLFQTQALVLCPTRELADQVSHALRQLGRQQANLKILSLCGGQPIGPQIAALEHRVHVVVGTPGRVKDHLLRQTLNLKHLKMLILDEADRMLDMGFFEEIEEIIARSPSNRQTMMFSATFSPGVEKIANTFLRDAVKIDIESEGDKPDIDQYFYRCQDGSRAQAMLKMLYHYQPKSAVVFCNTRRETADLAALLLDKGFSAVALHGELEQYERDLAMLLFSSQCVCILVATDVAARGLDVASVDFVCNYSPARDVEVHTHRIGRTGRAGQQGVAVTLVDPSEAYKLALIENANQIKIDLIDLPKPNNAASIKANMSMLQINAGKKQKLRAGDILGALTVDKGLNAKAVGKIKILSHVAYVAVHVEAAKTALQILGEHKMKGKYFKVKLIG